MLISPTVQLVKAIVWRTIRVVIADAASCYCLISRCCISVADAASAKPMQHRQAETASAEHHAASAWASCSRTLKTLPYASMSNKPMQHRQSRCSIGRLNQHRLEHHAQEISRCSIGRLKQHQQIIMLHRQNNNWAYCSRTIKTLSYAQCA